MNMADELHNKKEAHMFSEKEVNIIKALLEEEIGSLTNVAESSYEELINLYRQTLIAIFNKLWSMQN